MDVPEGPIWGAGAVHKYHGAEIAFANHLSDERAQGRARASPNGVCGSRRGAERALWQDG
eukprot:6111290-Pleurochrysis_carterae.AAC.1